MIRRSLSPSVKDDIWAKGWLLAGFFLMISGKVSTAQVTDHYDYHSATELIVNYGRQALMICNGLFVSNRTLEQIYEQELKLYRTPMLPPLMVTIDKERRTVAIGGGGNHPFPVMRAVYREGLGAVVLAPNQTFDDIDELPVLKMSPLSGDPSKIAWPVGDLVSRKNLPKQIDQKALAAAGEWAFDRVAHDGHYSQVTLSLLVVYKGDIVYERYAPGVDYTTKTRTWSTAKSIASTLIGIIVGEGKLALDDPLPFQTWSPWKQPSVSDADPRTEITLRDVLHMSSGLYPVDNEKEYVVGSWLSYWAGTSVAKGALDRGLVYQPGTHWDYENYDTILAVLALKAAIGDQQKYLEFPRQALFDKIGMRNTIAGVDRFGDFVLSSQVYTNARDLARFGLLFLNKGMWNGERVLPESWVTFVRTPAHSTRNSGNFYGGQWWLVPDNRKDVPQDAYSTAGHRGQYTVVVPSHDLVIVRRGLDWLPREYRFSQWDLTREVLKAFPKRPWGEKPKALSNGTTKR
ncbi:beta-lactamase family protein [bacterium]|nr:beta-lactamase family protein [bacterium]